MARAGTSFPGFEGVECLYAGSKTQVYRAVRRDDQLRVVLKTPAETHPTPSRLQSFEREYGLLRELTGSPHVLGAYTLQSVAHRPLLVLEDVGGTSACIRYPDGPVALHVALGLAMDTVRGLDELHAKQIVHRDVNPSNVMVSPDGSAKIADLSIATRLRWGGHREPAAILDGTLPYISPEQTGRTNRPVDHRSDFYSLGVTLYQWVTGTLPFEADDAIGWVHQHIASAPQPPHERADIPIALSQVIRKLLAKSADDRYQSATGILHDLTCIRDVVDGRALASRLEGFRPGACDVQEHFRLSDRMYGREPERDRLVAAFRTASDGQRRVCAIVGTGGIGKTALVDELIRPLVRRDGFLLQGKFDQYATEEVYSALLAAMRQWLLMVLSRDADHVASWRQRIEEGLGPRVGVLAQLLPELGTLLGRIPAPESGHGEAARLRTQLALDKLIDLVAQPDHPLVLVLDDVQWADAASIELLEIMLVDPGPRPMLLLLLFRGDEAQDPRTWLRGLADRAPYEELELGPLPEEAIRRWLADSLASSLSEVAPLARWVREKTQGNPFFVRAFLGSQHEHGHIRFDRARRAWVWDIDAIVQSPVTDNVVSLILDHMEQLPEATRALLPMAAAMGHRFELPLLARAVGQPPRDVAAALMPAIEAGLMRPFGGDRGWEDVLHARPGTDTDPALVAQFVHDRIQQAAYQQLHEHARARVHLEMGTALMALPPQERESQLFQIARHLRLAGPLLSEASARRDARAILVAAGERAQRSAAFTNAMEHYEHALALLPPDPWASCHDLALTIWLGRIACRHATGDCDAVVELAGEVLVNLAPGPPRSDVYATWIAALSAAGRNSEAIEVGRRALAELGEAPPLRPEPPARGLVAVPRPPRRLPGDGTPRAGLRDRSGRHRPERDHVGPVALHPHGRPRAQCPADVRADAIPRPTRHRTPSPHVRGVHRGAARLRAR